MLSKVSNILPILEEEKDSTKALVVLFPGGFVPRGYSTYFLSKQATKSIEAFDEALQQMVAFVEQEKPSRIIAVIPKRFRLDILAYLSGIVKTIEFVEPS
jgi:hypothetical protein